MDDVRFDEIIRRFGRSATRRGALAGALAMVAAARGGSATAAPQPPGLASCLRPGDRCDPERFWIDSACRKCCSGYSEERDGDHRCGCTPRGSGCGTSAACCENRECSYGVCGGPECYPAGGPCRSGGDCCSGACGDAGTCVGDAAAAAPETAPAPAGAPAETATADGIVTIGGDTSSSGTISADGPTSTDGATTTDGTTTTGTTATDGTAPAAPPRECRPTSRGCTLNEQCCSGSCVNGACA